MQDWEGDCCMGANSLLDLIDLPTLKLHSNIAPTLFHHKTTIQLLASIGFYKLKHKGAH